MPWYEKEQLKQAKSVDLLTYLQANEPHELRKSKYGVDEFRTATHSSLVISNGRWFWNKGGFGGRSALDFLIKVRGMEFLDAVGMILDSRSAAFSYGSAASHIDSAPSPARSSALPVKGVEQMTLSTELKLPETALLPTNAVAYLQKRGISTEIINRCLVAGILCESRNNQNVIFIGMDENYKPRFACQRGMRDDFKADVRGSDKRYSFALASETSDCSHLIVFESPIDLLSHITLQQRGDLACGLSLDADAHRLSLGGTSDVALMAFLERNPAIEQITLCLDADEAGQTAASKITAKLAGDNRFGHITITNRPTPGDAKDYNDVLLRAVVAEQEHKQTQPGRRYEAAI